MRHQKGKTEKRVVKTIKCIYSEPVILILLSARFDFWANEIFSNSIKPADNNFVTPSQEGVTKLLSPRFFSIHAGFRAF